MMNLPQNTLQLNTKLSFDFSGGNLSSDSGLLFIKEFIHTTPYKVAILKMLENLHLLALGYGISDYSFLGVQKSFGLIYQSLKW